MMKNRPFWGCNSDFQRRRKKQVGSSPETYTFEHVETFFKCTKKGLFLVERKWNFSRRSSDLVLGKLLLIESEFPKYNNRITRGKGPQYLLTSLIFTCSGVTKVANVTPLSQFSLWSWFLLVSLDAFAIFAAFFRAPFPLCHFEALLNLLLIR